MIRLTRMTSLVAALVCMLPMRPAVAQPVPSEEPQLQPLTDPSQLVGTYHMLFHLVTEAKIPVLGTKEMVAEKDLLVTIRQEGDKLVQHHTSCRVIAAGRQGLIGTRFPEGFVEALPLKTYELVLEQKEGRWSYRADLGHELIGVQPDYVGALPSDPTDPNVFDGDHDGKPGVTVQAVVPIFGAVDIYFLQRAHTVLEGQVLGVDSIAGVARVLDLDQRNLGASNKWFARTPNLRPIAAGSTFKLTRISDITTCAALLAL